MSDVNRYMKISAVKHAIRKKRCKIKTIFGKKINLTLFFGIFKVKKLHFAHFICKFAAFFSYARSARLYTNNIKYRYDQ